MAKSNRPKIYDTVGNEVNVGDILFLVDNYSADYTSRIIFVRGISYTKRNTGKFVTYIELNRWHNGLKDQYRILFNDPFYAKAGLINCRTETLKKGAVRITDQFTKEQLNTLNLNLIS
jgi:hypothetical protein